MVFGDANPRSKRRRRRVTRPRRVARRNPPRLQDVPLPERQINHDSQQGGQQKGLDKALAEAAMLGRVEKLESLLARGANPNSCTNSNRETALSFAAHLGSAVCIRKLIEKGADVNMVSVAGWSPLHMTAVGGHLDSLSLLIEARANIKARVHEGRLTALMLATLWKKANCVRALILAGADVDAVDEWGCQVLDRSKQAFRFKQNNLETVRALFETRCQPRVTQIQQQLYVGIGDPASIVAEYAHPYPNNEPNKDGHTPAILAEWGGNKALAKYIRDKTQTYR